MSHQTISRMLQHEKLERSAPNRSHCNLFYRTVIRNHCTTSRERAILCRRLPGRDCHGAAHSRAQNRGLSSEHAHRYQNNLHTHLNLLAVSLCNHHNHHNNNNNSNCHHHHHEYQQHHNHLAGRSLRTPPHNLPRPIQSTQQSTGRHHRPVPYERKSQQQPPKPRTRSQHGESWLRPVPTSHHTHGGQMPAMVPDTSTQPVETPPPPTRGPQRVCHKPAGPC